MEYINKVELVGIVGTITETEFLKGRITRLAVATNYGYNSSNNTPIIETTWHNVAYFGKTELKKGDSVRIIGRIRATRYTDSRGEENIAKDILANEIEKIDEPLTIQMEN